MAKIGINKKRNFFNYFQNRFSEKEKEDIDPDLLELMKNLLNENPEDRYDIQQIKVKYIYLII